MWSHQKLPANMPEAVAHRGRGRCKVASGAKGNHLSLLVLGPCCPPTLSPFFIPSSACHRASLGRSTCPQIAQEPRGKLPQFGAAFPRPPENARPPCLTDWGCLHDVRAQERLALSPGSPAQEPQGTGFRGILVLRWASPGVGISRPAANRIHVSHRAPCQPGRGSWSDMKDGDLVALVSYQRNAD